MIYFGNIIYDEELKSQSNRYVIYGAGKMGGKIYEYMNLNGMENRVKCFCDKNRELSVKTYKGLPIITPDEILNYKDFHILFGGIYAYEIFRYLSELNIKKTHFLYC